MPAAAELTYDQTMARLGRVIAGCEAEKVRLRAQRMFLTLERAVAELTVPGGAEELTQLLRAVDEQLRSTQALEDTAKALRGELARVHGPVRDARAASPEGGAEKHHYTGSTT